MEEHLRHVLGGAQVEVRPAHQLLRLAVEDLELLHNGAVKKERRCRFVPILCTGLLIDEGKSIEEKDKIVHEFDGASFSFIAYLVVSR